MASQHPLTKLSAKSSDDLNQMVVDALRNGTKITSVTDSQSDTDGTSLDALQSSAASSVKNSSVADRMKNTAELHFLSSACRDAAYAFAGRRHLQYIGVNGLMRAGYELSAAAVNGGVDTYK